MTTTAAVAVIVVAVIVIAIATWLFWRSRRSEALRSHFGPEYDDAIRKFGSRPKAEDALVDRQRRMENIQIRSLQPEERDRFAERWHLTQAEFVDNPVRAIQDGHRLVTELMVARGYPMAEFEHRAEYLSVDHPHVVRNYRAAHEIALRREAASTEDLRQGLVYYRNLFDELLEAHAAGPRRTI